MDRERQKYFYGKGYSDGMKEGKIQNLEYMVKMRQSILTLQAELKKARREVAKEIRADIWRENRNVHNRSADIVKAVFVKLEEIIDQNKVDEV